MKKVFLYILMGTICLSSCKRDEDAAEEVEVSIETQNAYDDAAAQVFMKENYFDAQGKVVAFSATDAADDNMPALNTYNPVTLPSGVIYIKIPSAIPAVGKTIGDTDVLRLASISYSFVAKATSGTTLFTAQQNFRNTIGFTGVPEVDPDYFYKKQTQLFGRPRSYYEIEGFQEAIKYFKSTEVSDSTNYNLQGLIIVPSRAAFARDSNFYDINNNALRFRDRSFIFNFQVYKTDTRTLIEM